MKLLLIRINKTGDPDQFNSSSENIANLVIFPFLFFFIFSEVFFLKSLFLGGIQIEKLKYQYSIRRCEI